MADGVGLTARFASKPLEQPKYSIKDVPKCSTDLSGSILQEITDRDFLKKSMAEMVLLCNEVTRRSNCKRPLRKSKKLKRTTKPLSLEYMADRLDVDDPFFGFIVRTERLMPNSNLSQAQESKFQKGMMQGFITVTTFTNWQKTFRWDSMHDSAFSYDEPELAKQMASRERKVDYDGSLSAEMQNTVRCGDIWNEGIVFPHIAEISLLGALGCGRTLVSLAIERLEGMNSTGIRNYDYVALQATKNSVQFYEAMGFVRVGAITTDENFDKKQRAKQKGNLSDECESEEESVNNTSDSYESSYVSKPSTLVRTTKMGQTPIDLANIYRVNVWDIIFLNKHAYPTIAPRSWLKKGIELSCPDPIKFDGISNASHNDKSPTKSSATQWYYALNNETPKQISGRIKVPCQHLIAANRERFQDLAPNSRLMPRTRMQVSNLTTHFDEHIPYCHWTFPDDEFESNEPSYMMARRLNRRKGKAIKLNPFECSLCAPKTIHVPKKDKTSETIARTPLENSRKMIEQDQAVLKMKHKSVKTCQRHPDEPVAPKRPKSALHFFREEEDAKLKSQNKKVSTIVQSLESKSKWNNLSTRDKSRYEVKARGEQLKYKNALKKYKQELEDFKSLHPECANVDALSKVSNPVDYFDKVVRLNDDGQEEAGGEFKYYYVLTFIPDLFWCHLAPLRSCGVFGSNKPEAQGRPMWVLVDENEGKEVDISASMCEIVESIETTKCQDADDERWDVLESGHCYADNISNANKLGCNVDENREDVTSVSANKCNRPRRKSNLERGEMLTERPSHRSGIEKNRKSDDIERKKSPETLITRKETKAISKGEGKRKRGSPGKNSSHESAVGTPIKDYVEDNMDDSFGAKRIKRSARLDSRATKDRKRRGDSSLDSVKKSSTSASQFPHVSKKGSKKLTRRTLDSAQPPIIDSSTHMDSSGPDGRKNRSDFVKKTEGSASLGTFMDKVVTLHSDGQEVGGKIKYYYVYTLIAKMRRCRLIPMKSCGIFGPSQPKAQGRPIWVLVDETETTEMDIDVNDCKIVESTATLKCADADYEKWDIPETGHCNVGDIDNACSKFHDPAHKQGVKVDINSINKLKLKRDKGTRNDLTVDPCQSVRSAKLDTRTTKDHMGRKLNDRKRMLESVIENKESITPITPSSSHGGIQESIPSKRTPLFVDGPTLSSDSKKGEHSNSICSPSDTPQYSKDAKEGGRAIIFTSSDQPLDLDKDRCQFTRENEVHKDMVDTSSLSNGTLCISEDSNQTFSDVSCEMITKDFEAKHCPKKKQLTIQKSSTRAQKSITSFFQRIK